MDSAEFPPLSLPIEKFDIKLKSRPKDGVILQLHHTVRSSSGESRRIRFVSAAFNDVNERLSCADNSGNIFILDFCHLKFWKLSQIGPCSAMHFVPNKLDALVIASTKKGTEVFFMDIESGEAYVTLKGHTEPVKHISFSTVKTCNLLTASPCEAILWELKNYTKYFTLNTRKGALIQQMCFSPVGDHLVACFQNDTVQVWKLDTLTSVKQIIPSELKHMKSIAFTMNGRAMVMTGLSPVMILFSLDTWKPIKSIDLNKYDIAGVKQASFIPQVFDGGSNKILALLSSDCHLHILDLETLCLIYTVPTESSAIRRVVVSPTGKYFVCILQLGEVNIYNSSYVMDLASHAISNNQLLGSIGTHSNERPPLCPVDSHSKDHEMDTRMRLCMDGARLRRILMQYGEYPEKFRSIIWRALLNTPRNKNAYASLLDKGIHPAFKDIEKKFTIHSAVTLKNLKRMLSCLTHWCPLFGVIKFLPGFVFPFVRVLQKDPLLLFECVASILMNYCQLWFEYAPFPPINVLAMIENVLAEHDQNLLDHFCKVGVTSQTYALKILETAFSEVLSCCEWLILWDHILSNEPSFILMAVVSYNIVQRSTLKKINNLEEFEVFFHMQNPLDKRSFIKKCYVLLNDTCDEIHPKNFLNSFSPIDKGSSYPQFTGYPKATICLKLAEKRKAMKNSQQLTLREMTGRTQEKVLSERYKKNDSSDENISSDDDNCMYNDNHRLQATDISPGKILFSDDEMAGDNANVKRLGGKVVRSEVQSCSAAKLSANNKDIDLFKLSPKYGYRRKNNEVTEKDLENEVEKLMKHLEQT